MPTNRFTIRGNGGGLSFSGGIDINSAQALPEDPVLNVAIAGTLKTRTTEAAGVLTLSTGHGLQNAQKICIFWAEGCAYGATITNVNVNDVTFSGAMGDALPDEDAVITAAQETPINTLDFSAAGIQGLCLDAQGGAIHLRLIDDEDAVVWVKSLLIGGVELVYGDTALTAISGDPVSAIAACGATTQKKLNFVVFFPQT